jgi:hypothetical protein
VSGAVASDAPPWPALPGDAAALDALVAARATRTPATSSSAAPAALAADDLREAIVAANAAGTLVAGLAPIAAALDARVERAGARSYLLFGSYHDAPAQLRAFRHVVARLARAPLVALEQLHADGRWPEVVAHGDDAHLGAFLATGDRAALAELARAQQRSNYTAWKYDYLAEVSDVLLTARALGWALGGCDMPSALQAESRDRLGERAEALRDLHCALTLADRLGGRDPRQPVALFYGDAHLARLPRFLPADAEIVTIHMLGGRPRGAGLEATVGVTVSDPVLVPIDGGYALLLREPPLAAAIERVRDPLLASTAEIQLNGEKGTLLILGDRIRPPGRAALRGGRGSFILELDGALVAGAIDGPTALEVDHDGVIRVVTRPP